MTRWYLFIIMKMEQILPPDLSDYEIMQEKMFRILGRRPQHFELAISDYPPVKTLDVESSTPVFDGPVKLRVDYWRVSDKPECSRVIQSPTWKEILSEVDTMLSNNNSDYIFLEGLMSGKRDTGGVLDVELVFGS